MVEININKINEDSDVKKVNIDNGLMWLEYKDDNVNEDPLDSIFLNVLDNCLTGEEKNETGQKIELFRIDTFRGEDVKKQRELCNKLITALKFIEKNWF